MAGEKHFPLLKIVSAAERTGAVTAGEAAESLYAGKASIVDDVLDAVFDGAYLVDTNRRIQKWNSGARNLTGFTSQDVVGRYCHDNILLHVDSHGTELCMTRCPLQQTLDDGESRQAIVYLRHKLGYRLPVSIRVVAIKGADGKVAGALETFRVAGEPDYWKTRTAELEALAFIDLVTGIPNRRFLEGQLDRLLHEMQFTPEPFVLCMLDLDHFKLVNDRYGHETGDALLHLVGRTLTNCMRASDIVGRWGGDEFGLLLPRTDLAKARQVLERARVMVAESALPIKDAMLKTTVSIGATLAIAGDDRKTLLGKADRELYRSKELGRNCCCVI